ncbi:MAG: hypothetical protein ACOX2O_07250 [Bdellovibrionota bacterium]
MTMFQVYDCCYDHSTPEQRKEAMTSLLYSVANDHSTPEQRKEAMTSNYGRSSTRS